MADIETGLVGGIGGAIVMGVKMLIDFLRGRDKASEDKTAETAQWTSIHELRKDFSQHRLDDAQSFASLEAETKHSTEMLREMKGDVKTLLRRSTDQIKRGE